DEPVEGQLEAVSDSSPVPQLDDESSPPEFAELEDVPVVEPPVPSVEQSLETEGIPQTEESRVFGDAMDAVFAKKEIEEESKPEVTVSVKAPEELFEEEDEFFDLAAELEEGFLNVQSAVEEEKPPDGQNYSLE